MLQPGDILLEANGTSLTGLTNHVISFYAYLFTTTKVITKSASKNFCY